MGDAAWALRTAREVGPIPPPHAHAHPIHKLHTGPLHSTVAGRTDHLPSQVPNGSFVLPADIVSGLGEGNTMSGFKAAKRMFEGAHREFGGTPYAGSNGPYGQGTGLPYAIGHAEGGEVSFDESKHPRDANGKFDAKAAKAALSSYYAGSASTYRGPTTTIRQGEPANKGLLAGNLRMQQNHINALEKKYIEAKDKEDQAYWRFTRQARGQPVPSHLMEATQKARGEMMDARRTLDDMKKRYGMASGGIIGRNEKQTLIGPGTEEWQSQPCGGVMDSNNAVTGPTMPEGDQSFQEQLQNNRNRQDIIDQHIGTEMAKGGSVDQAVPVAVAGGEHVLAPHEVAFAGMGDMEAGHKALEAFILRQRAKLIKTLKGLPGPKRD